MRVQIRYANRDELTIPTVQMLNPYDDLEFCVTGEIETVANWVDETFNAFYQTKSGLGYKQGVDTPHILEQLREGGVQEFGEIAFLVIHV